ncbi:hypothetical protein NDU88_005579 [Pleurodeles waltl]|uniref:Uncharacterized protein n=1 Tax=Pleurodeles waltl TaxID=8319 RepID=A0AAV7WCA0_PLEWA|nr:hypothetical protein NDU88_005579 [Pleurodeles waltl]
MLERLLVRYEVVPTDSRKRSTQPEQAGARQGKEQLGHPVGPGATQLRRGRGGMWSKGNCIVRPRRRAGFPHEEQWTVWLTVKPRTAGAP